MCKQCSIKPVYVFTNNRKVCRGCYIRWFEKKFLYAIKKFGMVKKGDVIGYKKAKDFRQVVLEYLLEIYNKKAPVKVVKKIKGVDKIAISITSDQVSERVVDQVIQGNLSSLKIKPVEKNIIAPLYLFLDKEVLLYAKLKQLKHNKYSHKKNFINDLEIKHPELKHSIVNSYLKLFN